MNDLKMHNSGETTLVPLPGAKRDAASRAERLKQAVRNAGGARKVAELSGVPFGTLSNYVAGREMKVAALIALSAACKVPLVWLATGAPLEVAERMPVKLTVTHFKAGDALFKALDMERLGRAITGAFARFEKEDKAPSPRELAMVTALLYDSDPEREAASAASSTETAET